MHERWSLIVTSPLQTLHRAQRELSPFFCFQKTDGIIRRAPHAKNKRGAHTRSMSLCIQVLRQKIHQRERTPAVDHFVDQIAFTAR